MDENKEVNSTDPKREKVRVIPLSAIDDAPDHPFGVRDDEEMAELVESISTFGVINPVIVRKGEGERYELISGHRRKYACSKLGIETLPVIVRDLSREEAIIFMVDSNLQREHILPSERAKAYSGSAFFSFSGFFGSMVWSGSIWIIVGIAVALAAAAVITVIVVKKRKKTAG